MDEQIIKNENTENLTELAGQVNLAEFLESIKPFREVMMHYDCAMEEVRTKIVVLDREFETKYKRNPVENIVTRLKKPISILRKLEFLHLPVNINNIQNGLHDIAGVRIICSFVSDIYEIANLLTKQDDITLIQTKDYIKSPKPNGYRSLHLLVSVPIFLSNGKIPVCVEVQIRTEAMDSWASVEHKIKYKKDIDNTQITKRLKSCAEKMAHIDQEMQEINQVIENLSSI
ncbi:MAG: GTP pyrophosphokinase family protein [Clostridia bacterium]